MISAERLDRAVDAFIVKSCEWGKLPPAEIRAEFDAMSEDSRDGFRQALAAAISASSDERDRSLQAIADQVDYWIRWVTREHGGDVTPDTSVILPGENAPPVWPTVGQLARWVAVLSGDAA